MKLLVTHASRTGSSESLARTMAETAQADGWEVTLSSAKAAPDPVGYDAVITGSGIRAGQWNGEAQDWVRRYRDRLREVPTAVYVVGLRPGQPGTEAEVARYGADFLKKMGIVPVARGEFAGSFHPGEVGLRERLLMRAMKQGECDRRDHEAVAAWTRQALAQLRR